ncbi:MAG: hypothetical protein ACYCYP_05790 [Leptospirales bacterium]
MKIVFGIYWGPNGQAEKTVIVGVLWTLPLNAGWEEKDGGLEGMGTVHLVKATELTGSGPVGDVEYRAQFVRRSVHLGFGNQCV